MNTMRIGHFLKIIGLISIGIILCMAYCRYSNYNKSMDNVKIQGYTQDAANAAGKAIEDEANATGKAIEDTANATGKAIEDTANAAGKAVKNTANKAGKEIRSWF